MINMGEDQVTYPGGGDKAIDDGVYVDLTNYVETYMPNYRNYRANHIATSIFLPIGVYL